MIGGHPTFLFIVAVISPSAIGGIESIGHISPAFWIPIGASMDTTDKTIKTLGDPSQASPAPLHAFLAVFHEIAENSSVRAQGLSPQRNSRISKGKLASILQSAIDLIGGDLDDEEMEC